MLIWYYFPGNAMLIYLPYIKTAITIKVSNGRCTGNEIFAISFQDFNLIMGCSIFMTYQHGLFKAQGIEAVCITGVLR